MSGFLFLALIIVLAKKRLQGFGDRHMKKTVEFTLLGIILVAAIVTGCGRVSLAPTGDGDTGATVERFRLDQQRRLLWLQQWQVSGILEINSEEDRRRLRTEMGGAGAQQVRMRVFGPMQQIVMMLFMGAQEIRLVDPGKQQIIEVPATDRGLEYLVGIGFSPRKLFDAMTAVAEGLVGRDWSTQNAWRTQAAERLILDPDTGLIQERFGQAEGGEAYRVLFLWDEETKLHGGGGGSAEAGSLYMPAQIKVFLEARKQQIRFKADQWQVPDRPFAANWFAVGELYPGFFWVRPFTEQPSGG